MNAAPLAPRALTCSAMSTTGPHTRLWHRAGVANSRTVGFLPTTSAKSSSCMVDGGTRVSIEDRLPETEAFVGVWIFGARSPTSGTLLSPTTVNGPPAGVAATKRLSNRATPSTS